MDHSKRSKIMQSIRSRDTVPELIVRNALYRAGFRYRLHANSLPGKPDIVLPKHKSIIQVNGCFWHGHDCHIFKVPKSPAWKEKIENNVRRDQVNLSKYSDLGWKCLIVWECALQGKERLSTRELYATLHSWILYDEQCAEIRGRGGNIDYA